MRHFEIPLLTGDVLNTTHELIAVHDPRNRSKANPGKKEREIEGTLQQHEEEREEQKDELHQPVHSLRIITSRHIDKRENERGVAVDRENAHLVERHAVDGRIHHYM